MSITALHQLITTARINIYKEFVNTVKQGKVNEEKLRKNGNNTHKTGGVAQWLRRSFLARGRFPIYTQPMVYR